MSNGYVSDFSVKFGSLWPGGNGRATSIGHKCGMIKSLYDWMMHQAGRAKAATALFWIAFVESSFFPIPPDVMLVPMVLADRSKAWRYATIATVGSVIGGLFGYAIGYYLLDSVGQTVLKFYGKQDKFTEFAKIFNEYGVWILIIKGMTPIPYKLLTITAGATKMNVLAFTVASIIARAMRFFLVAGLLYWFGEPIRTFIEKRLTLVTTALVALMVFGFVAVKYLI
jgi:membrane protein YqaA with SNARE-associated domain